MRSSHGRKKATGYPVLKDHSSVELRAETVERPIRRIIIRLYHGRSIHSNRVGHISLEAAFQRR